MKINKPLFWDLKNSYISLILLPLSLIFLFLIFLRKKFAKEIKFKIPIICVGNIYVGGTGKTPTSILIANELDKMNKNPVILRKFYKNHIDEHNFIKAHFKNLILTKNRSIGLKEAERSFDIVIMDDGFQDYKIIKNLNILCFNGNQLIGNGYIFPAGPLRESLSALKKAQIILINGSENKKFEEKILKINQNLCIFYSEYKPVNINQFREKKLLAIAGIGNPENFFKLISQYNLKIERKMVFPDHYSFSFNQIKKIVEEAKKENLQIITTEKDYYKIKEFNINEIEYLKVDLVINKKKEFLNKLQEYYD